MPHPRTHRRVAPLSRLLLAVAVGGTTISACTEGSGPLAPANLAGPASRTVVESPSAQHGLTFLPPLAVEQPLSVPFDPSAAPSVDVCRLVDDANPAAACGTVVAHFGSDGVKLDLDEQQYQVNWKTTCPTTACGAGLYRITVLSQARIRGSLVIRLGEPKPEATADVASFKSGRTIPIKFRLGRVGPQWVTIVPASAGPPAEVYATNAPTDNAIYGLVGGFDFQPHSLWRLDLATDKWTEIPTSGFPSGKYRRIVHDPVRHEILTYWDGLGQVWSVSETGGTWQPVGSQGNSEEWYEGQAFWHPTQGALALFGGYGGFAWKNTLWAFDRTAAAWSLLTQSATLPAPRFGGQIGIDESSSVLYLDGGEGYPTGSQYDGDIHFNDTWRLDLPTNTWTQLVPHDPSAVFHGGSGLDVVPVEHALYRFGGDTGTPGANHYVNDLDRLDLSSTSPVWTHVDVDGTPPTPRVLVTMFFDAPRNRLIVVGGYDAGGVARETYALLLP